jgi:serine/threonine-protein kinase
MERDGATAGPSPARLDSTVKGTPPPASTPTEVDSGAATTPAGAEPGRPTPGTLAAGQVIAGRYRVSRLLGRGGMGAVYEAEQLDLGRTVALKMLRADLGGGERGEVVDRFEREARLAAAIGHENIIGIHDIGHTEDGNPFIVMERLVGSSLETLLDDMEVGLERLRHLVDQLLAALGAAHAKGIVHRDVKPENVFVCAGPDDRVKVLDFGISKILEPVAGLEKLRLTRTGTLLGTPLYMSPEQAAGETALDLRVDLYAVGVVLYRALSGAFPHLASNFNQLMAALLTREPQPLEQRVPELHPAWARLVKRAMARERDQRFQSAEELRQALRELPAAALQGRTRRPASAAAAADAPTPIAAVGARGVPGSGGRGVSSLSSGYDAQRGQRRAAGWVSLLVVLAASGSAAVLWVGRDGPRSTPPAPPPAAAPPVVTEPVAPSAPVAPAAIPDAAAPAPAVAAPAPEVPPRRVRIRLRTRPANATVHVDGTGYVAPVSLERPQDPSARVEIAVSAPRHRSLTIHRTLDQDIDETLQLEPLREARPGRLREKLE